RRSPGPQRRRQSSVDSWLHLLGPPPSGIPRFGMSRWLGESRAYFFAAPVVLAGVAEADVSGLIASSTAFSPLFDVLYLGRREVQMQHAFGGLQMAHARLYLLLLHPISHVIFIDSPLVIEWLMCPCSGVASPVASDSR